MPRAKLKLPRIPDHRIVREIARGGMGAVFEAIQLGAAGFEKRVALKVILNEMVHDPEFVDMFIGEAKLVADLVHENIVQIYQLGRTGDTYWMSMEFIEGLALEDFVDRHSQRNLQVPVELAAYILSRVCRALEYAHTKLDRRGNHLGIVHRDVSPGNVLLTYSGSVKLTDFGVAKAKNLMLDLEGEVLLGKARYMSPEQARFHRTDPRSDVFSAGIVLYELLSGEALFDADDTVVTLESVVTREVPPIEEVAPQTPPWLAAVVRKALQRRPSRRYPTAGAMGYALERALYARRFGPTPVSLHRYLKSLFPRKVRLLVDPNVPDPCFERLKLDRPS